MSRSSPAPPRIRRDDTGFIQWTSPASRAKRPREVVARQDCFVLGGGGLLYDEDVEMYLRHLGCACDLGIPTMTYAISAGPLVQTGSRARVRDVLNRVQLITVRDRRSQQLLEDVGVEREIVLTADPALLLEREPLTLDEILRAEAIDPEARLIGLSVREPGPAAPELQVQHSGRSSARNPCSAGSSSIR